MFSCGGDIFVFVQASIKKENGQTAMVPLFQSLENIVGEVLYILLKILVLFVFTALLYSDNFWYANNVWINHSSKSNMQVSIEPIQGKKIEHTGVKIELLGQIGMPRLTN